MAEEPTPKFSIVKLIPVTVLVTLLSQTSIISYYHYYNFSPITYFDSYEIIIASIKEFIIVAFFVFFYFQTLQVLILPFISPSRNTSSNVNVLTFRQRRREVFIVNIIIYILVALMSIALYILSHYSKITLENNILIVGIVWIIMVSLLLANSMRYNILSKLRNHRGRHIKKYFPYIDPIVFVSVTVLFFFTMLLASSKYKYIVNKNPYQGTILTLESNEKIKCTSKVIFIGKSQKFYFVFNTPDSSVRIIDRGKLKKEVLKIRSDCNFLFRF